MQKAYPEKNINIYMERDRESHKIYSAKLSSVIDEISAITAGTGALAGYQNILVFTL